VGWNRTTSAVEVANGRERGTVDDGRWRVAVTLIEGTMPNKQRKLIVAWMEIRQEDLQANWILLQAGQEFFRIAPLQ
jgi:hypothetical protein